MKYRLALVLSYIGDAFSIVFLCLVFAFIVLPASIARGIFAAFQWAYATIAKERVARARREMHH